MLKRTVKKTPKRLVRKPAPVLSFAEGIPKCELHLHIEGSLEPRQMFELADRNRVKLKFRSIEEVLKAYNFTNLQSFLDIYYAGASVLLRAEDFYDMTYAYFEKAAADNVRHAEIFFDPQTHTHRGVPFAAVIDGISSACNDAQKKLGVSSYLILCFLRHLSAGDAMATLKQALPHKKRIKAVGLDSSESGFPPELFKKVFAQAMREGLLTVAHAGEEGPPSYVWGSLNDLKVLRIDHGVRSIEDPKLVEELVARKIPLTVCPLSNVKLGVYPGLKHHPLKKMLKQGLKVTINSDDPAYFGGYINRNFTETQKALGLTMSEIAELARNSFEASFLPKTKKSAHLADIELFVKKHSVRAARAS
jgi:adenosine deaminase